MKHQTIALIVMILAILIGLLGCTPRVCVTPNPEPHAKGIRYYRPKPYLKVVPAQLQVNRYETQVAPGLVTITLEYLPDFTEEYAIEVRSGLGIADVAIELDDGWNLTSISQDLDSQTDEQIAAVGDLVNALAGVVPTSKRTDSETVQFTVAAAEVPLGYYESVIGRGADGKKRLYGFRYVGFLPYAPCPIEMGGVQGACCGDPHAPLYGLTFHNGQMVFRPLQAMAFPESREPRSDSAAPSLGTSPTSTTEQTASRSAADVTEPAHGTGQPELIQAAPMPVLDPSTETPSTDAPLSNNQLSNDQRDALAAKLEMELLRELSSMQSAVQRVHIQWDPSASAPLMRVSLVTSSESVSPQVRNRAMQRLAEASRGRFLYRVDVR